MFAVYSGYVLAYHKWNPRRPEHFCPPEELVVFVIN